MYNRYLAASAAEPIHTQPEPSPKSQDEPRPEQTHSASVFGNLSKSLGGRLGNVKLDMDTILVLGIVWFILSDTEDGLDWDLMLIIGALLFLGL